MSDEHDDQNIVNELMTHSEKLIALLGEEKKALETRDADLLLNISYQKKILIDSFKILELKFNTLVKDPKSLNHGQDGKNHFYNDLKKALTTCKDQNMVNGLAIVQKLSSLKRFITLMSSKKGQDVCYNKTAAVYSETKSQGKIIV